MRAVPSIPRPDPDEFAPYYGTYISQVPDTDILDLLAEQNRETAALLEGVPPTREDYRYEPGKWSIKQVVGHLSDTERAFAYRALRFSRGDAQPVPGFEQDAYVAGANFDDRTMADLTSEFVAVRQGTLALFRSLSPDMLVRRGTASGVTFSVRAIPYIIAGHERHHVRMLRDRYRVADPT